MSHKYYGFQKQEDNFYTIPFLSIKTQRLRFLNKNFVGYGKNNDLIIHKNPGLTILRLTDSLINKGSHNQSNTQRLMNEFLNQLVSKSSELKNLEQLRLNPIKIREIAVNQSSLIKITFNTL